jgi:hypothetical protein
MQIMQILVTKFARLLTRTTGVMAVALGLPTQIGAQPGSALPTAQWSGIWNAEGSLLTLRVTHHNDQLLVEPLVTMGYEWRNSVGEIKGSSATLDVEYQGVLARLLVQLGDDNTAMVRALSCQPDYHVVCALVQNQQARFRRTGAASPQTDVPGAAAN